MNHTKLLNINKFCFLHNYKKNILFKNTNKHNIHISYNINYINNYCPLNMGSLLQNDLSDTNSFCFLHKYLILIS